MSNNGPSDSTLSIRKNGSSVIVGQGIVYPLEYLWMIRRCTTLAELAVISTVYGYDGIIGVDSEPLTFTDIMERSGLSKRSAQQGIERAIARATIVPFEANGTRYYLPNAKSSPHVHEHDSFKDTMGFKSESSNQHVHAAKSSPRHEIYQTLLNEFGMVKSERIAYDIALTPKYSPDKLRAQIRYTRWEIKRGEDSDPQKPIRNPAGRLVYRIKCNEPQPRGFNLVTCLLEDEGWTRDQLFEAVYSGEVDLPDIEGSFEYAAWLANEFGEEFD